MKWLKRKLINYLTSHLLSVVEEKYIITQVTLENGRAYYLLNGKKIDVAYLAKLKHEASHLKETELWKIFDNTLRSHAHKMMFVKSETFEDVLSGKLMLYNLDVQKKILDTLSEIQLQSK
jgi:hypothetical protein